MLNSTDTLEKDNKRLRILISNKKLKIKVRGASILQQEGVKSSGSELGLGHKRSQASKKIELLTNTFSYDKVKALLGKE